MNNFPVGQKHKTNNKQLLNVLHLNTFECLLAVAILKHFVLLWKDHYEIVKTTGPQTSKEINWISPQDFDVLSIIKAKYKNM